MKSTPRVRRAVCSLPRRVRRSFWRRIRAVNAAPKLKHGLRAWTSRDYNLAADAVMEALSLTPKEWGRVRCSIRTVLETPNADISDGGKGTRS